MPARSAISNQGVAGGAAPSSQSSCTKEKKRTRPREARWATAAAPPPAGSAKGGASAQSPAITSRLAGVASERPRSASSRSTRSSKVHVAKRLLAANSVRMRVQHAPPRQSVRGFAAAAATILAGVRDILQRAEKALSAWAWVIKALAGPAPAAGAGCQPRQGVLVTTMEVASRKIGESGVRGATGQVALMTAAAIVR